MKTEGTLYFPQGLALEANFCNRTIEQKRIKDNIRSCRPTLIMSPRRYGKTSLVLQALHHMKIPFVHLDLFSELNEKEVQQSILSAIGEILYAIETTPQKALKLISSFFSDLNVNFSFSGEKISIHFSKTRLSPAKMILASLKKLDDRLKLKKEKAVFFLDEFQRISQISESATIEGSIRHIAQESQNITFIFSGSNRHLLANMFDDKTKPLYKLCDRILLDRIKTEEYIPFIQEKFKLKTKRIVPQNLIELILDLTECHSYYVNVLCHKLSLIHSPLTEKIIETAWHDYSLEEKSNILRELDLLSKNQAKMLIAIAKYGHEYTPTQKEFIAITKFSPSSAAQALKVLEEKDYVVIDQNKKYKIIDPLVNYLFSEQS